MFSGGRQTRMSCAAVQTPRARARRPFRTARRRFARVDALERAKNTRRSTCATPSSIPNEEYMCARQHPEATRPRENLASRIHTAQKFRLSVCRLDIQNYRVHRRARRLPSNARSLTSAAAKLFDSESCARFLVVFCRFVFVVSKIQTFARSALFTSPIKFAARTHN